MQPNLTRSWAFRGHTPHLAQFYKQGKFSSFGALVVSPGRQRIDLYTALAANHSLNGLDVVLFLRFLLRQLTGPIVLLWDRGTIHRRWDVQEYLRHHQRLDTHWFPRYAPEVDPVEFVWADTEADLANTAPADIHELGHHLIAIWRRLGRSKKRLWACLYASDLPWKRRH